MSDQSMDIEYYDQTTVSDLVSVSPTECRYVYWRAGTRHEKIVNIHTIEYMYRCLVQTLLERVLTSLQKNMPPVITYYHNRRGNPTRIIIRTADGDMALSPNNQPEIIVVNVLFRTA